MNIKDITLKQWTMLGSLLLVLVVSVVAYYVFVPKQQALEKLQRELQIAKKDVSRLVKIDVAKEVGEAEKQVLAEQVPVSLEQSRFIKTVRQQETASGVTITTMQFGEHVDETDANNKDEAKATSKTTDKAKSKQENLLKSVTGKLQLQGDYAQVRKFIEQFSKMKRLVTINSWQYSTFQSFAPAPTPVEPQPTLPAPVTPKPVFTDEQLPTPLLKDRTPIYTETAYDRVVEMIRTGVPLLKSKHEIDIANLEIQQAKNRYTAGVEGKKEAVSILSLERAEVFITGANPNIRQVFGIPEKPIPQIQPIPAVLNNPLPLLEAESNKKGPIKIKMEIQFTIYLAPQAIDLLPVLEPIKTYEPAERSNPVEVW